MTKVLVVGQTPPPFHGQAISTQRLLNGNYKGVQLFHVRMVFSQDTSEVGKFNLKKLFHLFSVIVSVIYTRFTSGASVLYYMPAGPDRIPIYRDLVILLCTRWLFRKTIFHFRAAGISEVLGKLSLPIRLLCQWAYFGTDLAIQLSDLNPPDGEVLRTKKTVIIPNGMEDSFLTLEKSDINKSALPTILFVGAHKESKGVFILLEACGQLRKWGFEFKVRLIGKIGSKDIGDRIENLLNALDLKDYVELSGVVIGKRKWQAYAEADIFCFPSFFESESFGLVVLEAMQFELPVVATHWRGIPSVVEDGRSGFLVPIKDAQALAESIAQLLKDPALRKAMGKRGREIYLERFTIERFWSNMEEAFLSVATDRA